MKRSDPYMQRARELCTTAGIDPDKRVGDGRGRPAWTDYRTAARNEHNHREAVAAAESIVNLRNALSESSRHQRGARDRG